MNDAHTQRSIIPIAHQTTEERVSLSPSPIIYLTSTSLCQYLKGMWEDKLKDGVREGMFTVATHLINTLSQTEKHTHIKTEVVNGSFYLTTFASTRLGHILPPRERKNEHGRYSMVVEAKVVSSADYEAQQELYPTYDPDSDMYALYCPTRTKEV